MRLATFDGSIVIRGWDRDEVSVEIEKRGHDQQALDDIEIVTEQKGSTVAVEAREKAGAGKRSYQIGFGSMLAAQLLALLWYLRGGLARRTAAAA